MNGWSVGIAKIFGVEVRLHSFFLFLLIPAGLWAQVAGRTVFRGIALWGLLLLAVGVRELARALAAAYFYLEVRSVMLLPTGGLFTYAGAESETRAAERRVQRGMAMTGPIANGFFGLMLIGFTLTIAPAASLLAAPWVSPLHLVRTMIWVNLLLAALNLLPAWPLDGGRIAHGEAARSVALDKPGAAAALMPARARMLMRMSWMISATLIVYGLVSLNWWLMMAGMGVLLGSQVERQTMIGERPADQTRVGEVMLTDYTVLPASATLEDAMMHARHSLQDIFPVVRAGNMVGAVGRQNILDALAATGNGYVQGIMTRSFQTASVEDSLMETLNRAVVQEAGSSLQIVPVVEGTSIVGILTPQHLQRSLGLIPRRLAGAAGRTAEDETD
jgi:Zn-dependent protease/predicted transcriptional regulator